MSKQPKIRLAMPGDAEALGTIQAESHQVAYRGIMPDSVLARLQAERLSERFKTRLSSASEHQYAIDDLVARGFDPLILWAFADNRQARRFYEQAGWILDTVGENWVLDGVPCPIVRYLRKPTRPSESLR